MYIKKFDVEAAWNGMERDINKCIDGCGRIKMGSMNKAVHSSYYITNLYW